MKMKLNILTLALALLALAVCGLEAGGQEAYSLKQCLEYALAHNNALAKDRLELAIAAQSKREVVGALLPQVSASSGWTRNLQKATIAMPNFINAMLPERQRDPNAPKYMTVTMGMDYTANWGAGLNQQLVNFALFNAVSIAKVAGEMAELGVEMTESDVIAQTATLYYGAQALSYAVGQFDESVALLDRTLRILEADRESGLMRQVDVDRVSVSKSNLETQRGAMERTLELQKNLLKLQMGFPMSDSIRIPAIDPDRMEKQLYSAAIPVFDVTCMLPYKILKAKQMMLERQYRSTVYEALPVVTFGANYSMNYMGDHFSGETFHHFPVSMLTLNLRMPLFTGLSRTAKIKKARIELQQSEADERMLTQSLAMGEDNARRQLEQQLRSIASQKRNKALAEEVYRVTESNFKEGISSLSDLLNASSSLVQARMNYVNALGESMKAYIDLKKAVGTIQDLKQQ